MVRSLDEHASRARQCQVLCDAQADAVHIVEARSGGALVHLLGKRRVLVVWAHDVFDLPQLVARLL